MLVGRVEAAYGGDPAETRVADIASFIDEQAGEVRTTHGQLVLNHKRGLLRIDAPPAQGVVGFLADSGGGFELSDLSVRSGNRYATVLAVAMDGEPLASSQKVLVQVGTTARPTGWQVEPETREIKGEAAEGFVIRSTGRMPWLVRDTDVQLTIANPSLTTATRLDEMGFAAEEVAVETQEDGLSVDLPSNTMYLLLTAD
jgi:hypothetical protein